MVMIINFADSDFSMYIMEAAKRYCALKDLDIKGVHIYRPVIKKLTKTIIVEL